MSRGAGRSLRRFGPFLCSAVLSCSGGMARVETRVADLQVRMDEMAGAARASQNRLATLENRILLLQDEVETLRMAVRRGGGSGFYGTPAAGPAPPPPELPTVRLAPPPARDERPDRAQSPAPTPMAVMDEGIYQEIDDEGNVVPPSGGRRTAVRNPPPGPPAASRAATPRRDPEEDVALQEYQSAYDLYRQGRVLEARTAFEAFVARHPRHPYSDNAQYWVGECLYDQKDFEGARRAFLRVMTDHPDGNKVPDAMVKVGLCDRALGRHEDANRMFRTVMLTYPDTEAAAVAMRLAGESP